MRISNIKSPQLEIVVPQYEENEINRVFETIESVNHCEIAYNALCCTFLNNKITSDLQYYKKGDSIEIYSLRIDKVLAKIALTA